MAFKSSNELRVEIGFERGRMVPRHVYRGDTEIQVKEMSQTPHTLTFMADLGAELVAPIAPLPPDEAAAAALSADEKAAIHQKAIDDKLAANKATTEEAKKAEAEQPAATDAKKEDGGK
ncbi:MAG: hypothetical protein J0I20_35720 [Chloroflexi bacterium]|nr:hypothetical protein [Chloroflexota bacterium]